MTNRDFYQVRAEKLAEGEKCVIWAEQSSNIAPDMAANIAEIYDKNIYPKMINTFGLKNFYLEDFYFDNIMDFSSWLVSGDGKLTILLLDIIDGYRNPEDSYIAGYFSLANFFSKKDWYYSNETDMIYVDTYPGLREDPQQTYAVLAHELQHLINFVTSLYLGIDMEGPVFFMDTWINEGLSTQAEYLYLEEHPEIRYKWFIGDPSGTIARGNNFFVWDNYPNVPNAILDEYATVYLFFQWLYLQANETLKPHLFHDIVTSRYSDYQAVTDVAGKINLQWSNWDILLRTWLAANYINHPNNEYGYKNDPVLKDIGVKTINSNGGYTVKLYPGEGVYSIIGGSSYSPPAGSGSNIRYAGLGKNSATLNDTAPYNGNVLLTFNSNNDCSLEADIESGYVTGNSDGTLPVSAGSVRAAGGTSDFGPLVLDARDIVGRHNEADLIKNMAAKYLQYANK